MARKKITGMAKKLRDKEARILANMETLVAQRRGVGAQIAELLDGDPTREVLLGDWSSADDKLRVYRARLELISIAMHQLLDHGEVDADLLEQI